MSRTDALSNALSVMTVRKSDCGGTAAGRHSAGAPDRREEWKMSDPVPLGDLVPGLERERRLAEIRREAERRGKLDVVGGRPPGAPFPQATPETGYYKIPLLKEPPWKWEIPLYFFVGGAAGAAAVVGALADYTGVDRKLVKHARWIAAAGSVISPVLLLADLGRRARFLA